MNKGFLVASAVLRTCDLTAVNGKVVIMVKQKRELVIESWKM